MKPFSDEAYYLLFSAMANRTRLAIIDVLKDESKTTLEISKILGQQEATIAHGLKSLERCMIVNSRKSGKKNLYSLNKEIVEPLSEILSFYVNKYCPGLEKCIPPQKLKEYIPYCFYLHSKFQMVPLEQFKLIMTIKEQFWKDRETLLKKLNGKKNMAENLRPKRSLLTN